MHIDKAEGASRLGAVFGIQTAKLVPACLAALFQMRGWQSPRWADLGTGDATFFSIILRELATLYAVFLPNGICADAAEDVPVPPAGFQYIKRSLSEFVGDGEETIGKFQIISLFEVIEHLEKDAAREVLRRCIGTGRTCLISTPSGFLKQDGETHPETLGSKPYQWHRCGFTESELHALGFSTIVFKHYHIRPQGTNRNFDCIVGFSGLSSDEASSLRRCVASYRLRYFLNPLTALRVLRSVAGAYYRGYLKPHQ